VELIVSHRETKSSLQFRGKKTILSKGEDKTRQVGKDFFILSFLPIFVSVKEIKGEQ